MIAPRHLKNAPIKEALIDIQVTLSEDTRVEKLDSKYNSFSNSYPKKEMIQKGRLGFQFDEGQPIRATVDQNFVGYKYTSQDDKQIVQFRKDGFTFSRLEPYHTWEEMKEDAIILWKSYMDVASPTEITRVATRYINVLQIPLDMLTEFKDFLTAPPQIPEQLPQEIGSFLTRVVIYEPTIGANCILTQALEPIDTDKEYAPIVLDIDVFMKCTFNIESGDYWEALDRLRDFKNQVFFESITEKAAGLFQ